MSDLPTPASGNAVDFVELDKQLFDNSAYEEMMDPAMCRRFITACVRTVRFLPTFAEEGLSAERISFDIASIHELLKDAREWLATEGARIEGRGLRYMQTGTMRNWGKGWSRDRRNYGDAGWR